MVKKVVIGDSVAHWRGFCSTDPINYVPQWSRRDHRYKERMSSNIFRLKQIYRIYELLSDIPYFKIFQSVVWTHAKIYSIILNTGFKASENSICSNIVLHVYRNDIVIDRKSCLRSLIAQVIVESIRFG